MSWSLGARLTLVSQGFPSFCRGRGQTRWPRRGGRGPWGEGGLVECSRSVTSGRCWQEPAQGLHVPRAGFQTLNLLPQLLKKGKTEETIKKTKKKKRKKQNNNKKKTKGDSFFVRLSSFLREASPVCVPSSCARPAAATHSEPSSQGRVNMTTIYYHHWSFFFFLKQRKTKLQKKRIF